MYFLYEGIRMNTLLLLKLPVQAKFLEYQRTIGEEEPS